MLKKISKALDEMAKNEELMAGILDQVEGIGVGGGDMGEGVSGMGEMEAPVHPEVYNGNDGGSALKGERLITIGEDKDEDLMQHTNKNAGGSQMSIGQQQ